MTALSLRPTIKAAGAAIALGFLVLWMGRRHLLRACRLALSGRPDPQDPRSPASYRVLLLGFLLAFAYMVVFCMTRRRPRLVRGNHLRAC